MSAPPSARLAAIVMLLASGCGLQRAVLFPAPIERRTPAARGATLVTLSSPTGDVVALHVAAPPGQPTIAYLHGNGQDLAGIAPLVAKLREEGFGVYAIEYPGYGIAGGEPTERSVFEAAARALSHLNGALGVPPADVVLMGQSLGTGVAVEMAARGYGARLVLVSPYTSIDALAHHFTGLPAAWLVDDHFDSAAKAPRVSLPVLVVAGTDDTLVPAWMSAELAERFPDAAILWIRGAHHNDLFVRAGRDLIRTIGAFARLERRQVQ